MVRFSSYLAETRILVRVPAIPLVKALLQLAETMVRDGLVKDPLGFYGDLSSQSAPSIARLGEDGSFRLSAHQVYTPALKKAAAAMALSPEGIRLRRDQSVHIVILSAGPEGLVSPGLALPSRIVNLLGDPSRRERLLSCPDAAGVLARLLEFERFSETTAQGA
jgi:hypothetical protein